MPLWDRIRYAAVVTVVIVGAVGMVLSIAGIAVIDILFNPLVGVSIFAVALAVAPLLARFLPYRRS